MIVRDAAQGKTRLTAATRGLVRIDAAALARLNAVPDVSIYTLFDQQPVDAGTVVAEAKCTPLLIAATHLDAADGGGHGQGRLPGGGGRAAVRPRSRRAANP